MALASYDFQGMTEHAQKQLGRQVQELLRDAAHISATLGRFGADAGNGVGQMALEVADEAIHKGAKAARIVGRQAWRTGKAVREDPMPAVMAVIGVACLLNLVLSRSRRWETRH